MAWWYKQITSERDLSNTNFANGVIKYVYKMNANQQINLDKSFLRIRVKLSKADGTSQLDLSDGIAPNYLFAYNLFKQMYHCVNGIQVGECRSYCSQVGALRHRITYPQSYKDKFLATSNFAIINVNDRINDVIANGVINDDKYINYLHREREVLNWRDITNAANNDTVDFNYDNGVAGESAIQYVDTAIADRVLFRAGGVATGNLDPALVNAGIDVGKYVSFTLPSTGGSRTYVSKILRIETAPDNAANGNNDNKIIIERPVADEVDVAALAIGAVGNTNNLTFNLRVFDNQEVGRGVQEFEVVFKPPMGVWHKSRWLPAHDLSLKLYPHPDGTWQKNAIESLDANKTHNTDFKMEIQDMIMYAAVLDVKHPDGEYSCEYDDMRCQLTNITTTSNVDYHFVVDRDAYGFTVALQDENCENDTRRSCTKFKIRQNQDLKLQRYYVDFNGRILPNPYPDISKTSARDFLTQRYYESIFYSDANANYDVESLDDWENAGMYFTHKFGKSRTQTEKCTVSTLFEDGSFGTNDGVGDNALHRPNLLLFDHFKRIFKMVVSGGKVREIYADKVN